MKSDIFANIISRYIYNTFLITMHS